MAENMAEQIAEKWVTKAEKKTEKICKKCLYRVFKMDEKTQGNTINKKRKTYTTSRGTK